MLIHSFHVQWNPFCKTTLFVPDMWLFKRGDLLLVVEINTMSLMLRFTLSFGFSRWVGLSSGWSLKRGSTVYPCYQNQMD